MNVDLMLKVANYIEHHPEEYHQGNWCGTACCIAGHAVMLGDESQRPYVVQTPPWGAVAIQPNHDENYVSIPEYARMLLDIHEDMANVLFAGLGTGAVDGWPPDFQFAPGDSSDQRAHKAAMFLRHLVAEELQRRKDEDSQAQEQIAAIQEEPELILA